MDIKIKDLRKTHTIGDKEFTIDYGRAEVIDANNDLTRYLISKEGMAEDVKSVELNEKICKCLSIVFGAEQYQKLVEMGATNYYNAPVIATMVMKDSASVAEENSLGAILKEFGIE